MKKYIKNLFIFILIIISLFIFSGCQKSENDKLGEKVHEELEYLDLEITSLINYINNITIENYKISTKEISLR